MAVDVPGPLCTSLMTISYPSSMHYGYIIPLRGVNSIGFDLLRYETDICPHMRTEKCVCTFDSFEVLTMFPLLLQTTDFLDTR